MTTDLKQCPYCKPIKCAMDEPCDGCETKAEYIQSELHNYSRSMKENFDRFEELRIIKDKTPAQQKEYSFLLWVIGVRCFPVNKGFSVIKSTCA